MVCKLYLNEATLKNWQLNIGHVESIYATKTGVIYSPILLPTKLDVKHIPAHTLWPRDVLLAQM